MQKLTWGAKISYGIGAFGKDLVYAIVATFFMFYLTDTCKISPIFIGNLFLAARLFDAINDPIMGLVVDNTRTRWGRFRPWILLGTILNAIVLVFLFLNPGLSGTQQLVYIATTYILWGLTYTLMDIPFWSMIPALTDDEKERDTISVIPRIFASAAWMLIGSFGLPLVQKLGNGDQALGFAWLGGIVAAVFLFCSIIDIHICQGPFFHPSGTEPEPDHGSGNGADSDQKRSGDCGSDSIAPLQYFVSAFQRICGILFQICDRNSEHGLLLSAGGGDCTAVRTVRISVLFELFWKENGICRVGRIPGDRISAPAAGSVPRE